MSDARSGDLPALGAPQAPVQWVPDVLLQPVQAVPQFLRSDWDDATSSPFGPWRLAAPSVAGHPPDAFDNAVEAADDRPDADLPLVSGQDLVDAAFEAAPSATDLQALAALKAAEAQAYDEGLRAGAEKAHKAQQAERDHERELLRHLTIELRALHDDPQRFFEPLKRLAVHLAEELVRAELQVSGRVVSQLVRQVLEQLRPNADKAVVSLHPDDLQRLQAMGDAATQGLRLEADAHLRVGSVRARFNETVVQDLIEHRLEALVRPLLKDPDAWLPHSSLLQSVQAVSVMDRSTAVAAPAWPRSGAGGPRATDVEDASLTRTVDGWGDPPDEPPAPAAGRGPEQDVDDGL